MPKEKDDAGVASRQNDEEAVAQNSLPAGIYMLVLVMLMLLLLGLLIEWSDLQSRKNWLQVYSSWNHRTQSES